MKLLRCIGWGLAALVLVGAILIATCPASVAWRWFGARLPALALDGISGSIWQGHAQDARAYGQPLGALDWQLQALPLLRGMLVSHVALQGTQVTGSGMLTRGADGSIRIADAHLNMPASLAAPALDIPMLQLLGTLDVRIAQLELQGVWPTLARGAATWQDAAVAGAAQARFGAIEAQFDTTADGSITGTVHDQGGPLQVEGSFVLRQGKYDARAVLLARDGNPQVAEALRYIGQPQPDGSMLLLIHGELFGLP